MKSDLVAMSKSGKSESPTSEASSRWEQGSALADFRLHRPIGLGHNWTTYKARDASGRLVALQKITPEQDGASVIADLRDEARRYQLVGHANLVSLHEISEKDGSLLMSTEFVDGAGLHWHLRHRSAFTVARAVRIVLSVAEAVQSLHEAGLLHRAIRPDTIGITSHGRAKLGVPRFRALAASDEDWLATSAGLHAAEYMAPEQLESQSDASRKSDIYALGATLYSMITGVVPFSALDYVDSIEKKITRRFSDPAALVAGLDSGIADLIRRSLDPDPELRPASVAAFVEGLQDALEQLGNYTLLEEIGCGNSAFLFRAKNRDGQEVALKILREEAASDERRVMRFYQEAKLAMHLDHPHVIQVLEVGEDRGRHFIALDYIDGENLARWTMRRTRLEEGVALRIIGQVAEAVQYLHSEGIIHRDVNPANILIDRAGNAVLSDLGLSKQMDFDLGLTAAGSGLGTALFAAPELILDAKNARASADIYGLGATLCSLVTGKRPFSVSTLRQLLQAKQRGMHRDPEKTNPSLTWQTTLLIKKAMRPVPSRRPMAVDFVKYVRICQQACRMATRQAMPLAEAESRIPRVWHLRYTDAEGEPRKATATTDQIRRLNQTGSLGPGTEVAGSAEGPYRPLRGIPELHQLAKDADPGKILDSSGATGPFLARILTQITTPWQRFRRSRKGPKRNRHGQQVGSRSGLNYAAIATATGMVLILVGFLSIV